MAHLKITIAFYQELFGAEHGNGNNTLLKM